MNETPPTPPTPGIAPRNATKCRSGLCSVGLLRSFCPSCMVIGIVMLPFELVFRGLRKHTISNGASR